ncbi:MAG: SH3 domain-containing protein [Rickettsiales bacterium]|nr:SH3 domain-containing protein [Rickettsiales bacterium]
MKLIQTPKPSVERSRNQRKVPASQFTQEPSVGFDSAQPTVLGLGLKFFALIFLIFSLLSTPALASRAITEVNYFASLRAAETNVRAGPGQNYPIKFTFKLRGLPVRVINEYDNWNEIEDFEGQTGWVTQSLLTKKRTLLVQTKNSFINMHSKNNAKSRIIFRLENNVVGDYLKCSESWCGIKVAGKKGWVQRDEVFGGDEAEETSAKKN